MMTMEEIDLRRQLCNQAVQRKREAAASRDLKRISDTEINLTLCEMWVEDAMFQYWKEKEQT